MTFGIARKWFTGGTNLMSMEDGIRALVAVGVPKETTWKLLYDYAVGKDKGPYETPRCWWYFTAKGTSEEDELVLLRQAWVDAMSRIKMAELQEAL